ncbi:hypothetical protein QUA56_35200 [Microcoleus sp. N3A4]|uniref:hypothetical protein n=1 Tax=Microcoleus sp. N3A4 TaxID=3055379 RepID=UPI002FD72816
MEFQKHQAEHLVSAIAKIAATFYAKNMDLFCYIESVRQGLCHARPNDTWEVLWRRIRIAQKKNWTFWRAVIYALRKEMELILKAPLTHSWLGAFFLKLLVHIFFCAVTVNYKVVEIEPREIETNSDPPKIFIPFPKIESNGCARSDSLLLAYF